MPASKVTYTGPTIECHACKGTGHDAHALRESQTMRHAETDGERMKSFRCRVCVGRRRLKPNGTRIDQ